MTQDLPHGWLAFAAECVNVQQELLWLELPAWEHPAMVRLFRTMEREARQCLAQQARQG